MNYLETELSPAVVRYMLVNHFEIESYSVWAERKRAIMATYYDDGTSCEDGEPMLLTDPSPESDLPDYF